MSFTKRTASHELSVPSIGPRSFKAGVFSRLTFWNSTLNEQRQQAAKASAVLTVEADGHTNVPEFLRLIALCIHCGFIPSRIERLYVLILQFDQNLTEVQDGFVRVADLELLIDHQSDLLSCEKAFSFCAASS